MTKSWPAASPIPWPSLLWIGALHLGALLALVPSYFSGTALGVCLALHWLTGGIGICMTYHRLLTHRSFATRPRWLEYVLTVIGCCASEGGPIGWVADHRNHHAHSDDEHDVHSPIRVLSALGLARSIKLPNRKMREAGREFLESKTIAEQDTCSIC